MVAMALKTHRVLLSVDLGANPEAPPTEFRLFKAGENPTTKGVFLFDAVAAKAVMAAYTAQGVDLIMDLEHLSLDSKAPHYDPDARAHYGLEVRNGELWAVNVRWTSDGRRRLAEKTQRYPSPAFLADEDGRIREIVNTALVSMPATHGAPALVAAARGCAPPPSKYTESRIPRALSKNMNPELLKKILAAIEAGDDKSGLLAEIVAQAAGGAPAPDTASDALSDTAQTPPAEEPKPELSALTARLAKLEADKAESVKTLSARIAELEAERASEDQAERIKLVGELVKLGAETPASAWEGEPEKLKPCKRLQAVALSDMREHVKALSARGPVITNAAPPKGEPGVIKLSKEEQAYCTKHGLTPEQFQAKKASAVKKATK